MKVLISDPVLKAFKTLNSIWKATILGMLLAFLASMITFISLTVLFRSSSSHGSSVRYSCYLNVVKKGSSLFGLEWSEKRDCLYAEYAFLFASILAFFLFWFVVVFRTSLDAFLRQRPTSGARLVPVAFGFSVILTLLTFIAMILQFVGFKHFCSSLFHHTKGLQRCANGTEIDGRIVNLSLINTAEVAAVICFISWVLVTVLLAVRLFKKMDYPTDVKFPLIYNCGDARNGFMMKKTDSVHPEVAL